MCFKIDLSSVSWKSVVHDWVSNGLIAESDMTEIMVRSVSIKEKPELMF